MQLDRYIKTEKTANAVVDVQIVLHPISAVKKFDIFTTKYPPLWLVRMRNLWKNRLKITT